MGFMEATTALPLRSGLVVSVNGFGLVTVATVGRRYFTGVRVSDGAILRSTGNGLAHSVQS
jgi:hypothetical protein